MIVFTIEMKLIDDTWFVYDPFGLGTNKTVGIILVFLFSYSNLTTSLYELKLKGKPLINGRGGY